MNERREVDLPSGAMLRIQVAPFAQSKALYQAVLRELKDVKFGQEVQVSQLIKDAFCLGFSSVEIEKCLWECFKSCTYDAGDGEIKIGVQTFEPVAARDDYMSVCVEVAKDNISPFVKTLSADFSQATDMLASMAVSRE